MDNLAHALVGAALGRAVADRHVPRAGLIGVVAANAPDWAELFTGYPWPRAQYLVEHRGITHSLLGATVEVAGLVVIVGAILLLTRRQPAWGWLTLCIAAAVLSHLYMDWQGSYGLRPFLPWDGTWYYADWVAIVDPFFWLVPLIALAWGANRHWRPLAGVLLVGGAMTYAMVRAADIVAPWLLIAYGTLCLIAVVGWMEYWVGPVDRRRAAAAALAILALYAGAQAVVVQGRKAEIREAAHARFGPGAQWAALTNVGHPFTWEPIYAGSDTVASDDWRIPRRLDDPRVQRALDTPDGRAMALFARFLAADVAGETVFLLDARYARSAREGWAVVRVRTD